MNGLIIQWARAPATASNYEIKFPVSFTSRTSYVVIATTGNKECETRTTKADDSGYDYCAGIDRKYIDRVCVSAPSDIITFLIAIGY